MSDPADAKTEQADVQSAVISQQVQSLTAQVETLTQQLEKQGKKKTGEKKEKKATSEKREKKEKKEKKTEKTAERAHQAKKPSKKVGKAEEAAAAAAAAAKIEKKALKKAAAAAELAAATKKKAKKAKRAAEAAAAAAKQATEAAQKTSKSGKKKTSSKSSSSSSTAGTTAASETGQVTNTAHVKIQSGKKVAKSLPNSTSLTWTSDSSIDILAGQNFCFPIEIADSRPSVLEWTFQTAGGDINFSIGYSRKATKSHKKKHIAVFPETRVDSYCDEHTQADAFNGAINREKALATALTTFYSACAIDKDAESTNRAASIFKDRQEEMVQFLQKKYLKDEADLSKADTSLRKKALQQLKKDLRRPPHLIHLEQGGCFKIIGSVDITGPGTVRLVWDNSFSWMRSKQLIFSVKLKAQAATSAPKK